MGYDIGAWIDDTLLTAAVELAREHNVPDRLANSLRHLLVIYVIAERLECSAHA